MTMDAAMEDNDTIRKDNGMNVDDSQLSFGPYLQKARLAKGMSIEDVMDYTRISKFVVEQIEADNLSKLPEPVFLKGFLKTFAEAVGADPAEVLRRYNRVLGKEAQQPEGKSEFQKNEQVIRRVSYKTVKQPRNTRKRSGGAMGWLIVLVVGAALAAGIYYYVQHRKNTAPPADQAVTPAETGPGVETPVPGGAPGNDGTSHPESETGSGTVGDAAPVGKATVDGYHLEVVCVEKTTVKVSVDNGAPDEYRMKPGDHVDLKAATMFNILVEDKCGVSLFLNNNPVTLPGKCGQSVNIQLP